MIRWDSADMPYPVDFWLYDARITFDFTAEAFAEAVAASGPCCKTVRILADHGPNAFV